MSAFKKICSGTIKRIKEEKVKVILLLWPILFLPFFSLYNDRIFPFFENYLIKYFEHNYLFDVILSTLIILFIFIQIKNLAEKRVIKFHYYEIHLLLISLLIILSSRKFTYDGYEMFKTFPYLIFISIIIILTQIIKLFYFIRSVDEEKFSFIKASSFFDLDAPIEDYKRGEDILNREKFANQIVNEIYSVRLEIALAISLTGGWGTGKSSLLKLIKKKLEEKTSKSKNTGKINNDKIINQPILIEFNPWLYSHNEDIVIRFFESLKSNLSHLGGEVPELITKYLEEISSAEENFIGTNLVKPFTRSFNDYSIKPILEKLERTLKSIKTNIIVFIDDIDRLEAHQIIDVFKVIRLTSNLPNIVFIACFDKEYVTNSLKDQGSASDYYEKIFQVDFCLPEISESIIISELEKVLEELHKTLLKRQEELNFNGRKYFEIETKKEISVLLRLNYLKYFFSDLRDIKRFKNQILFNARFLEHEVSLMSFVCIHLIRLRFPEIYKAMYLYRSMFVAMVDNRYVFSNNNLKPLGFKVNATSVDDSARTEILLTLFSESTNVNSIIHYGNYERYFTLEPSGLTNQQYNLFFDIDQESFEKEIVKLEDDALIPFLLVRIKNHINDIKNESELYRIILILKILAKQNKIQSWLFIDTITLFFEINFVNYKDDLKNLFIDIFENITSIELAINLYKRISDIIDIKMIHSKNLKELKVFKEFDFVKYFVGNRWNCLYKNLLFLSQGSEDFFISLSADNKILYTLDNGKIQHEIEFIESFTDGLNLIIKKHMKQDNGSTAPHSTEHLFFENDQLIMGKDLTVNNHIHTIQYKKL